MGDYRILAKDWDALLPKEEIFKQKDFFQKIIDQYSVRTCLDCACGTGWHLYMLDGLGVESYGSDLSPEMISLAGINTADKGIVLKEVDYRCLGDSWDIKFNMIICMSNSFRHMIEQNDIDGALNSMYNQLNDGGILVIDNGLSDQLIEARPKLLPGRILSDQAFYFILEYPNDNEIVFNILNVKKTKDSFEHSFETMHLSAMKHSDYEKCFSRTRFESIDYFGGYDFSKYSPEESSRMIVIAQKYSAV